MNEKPVKPNDSDDDFVQDNAQLNDDVSAEEIEEIGGVSGPEPTRFGDWEKNGRCIDF